MTDDRSVDLPLLLAKARLFDEFPPSEEFVTAKLEALALQVALMRSALGRAEEHVRASSIGRIDAAIKELEVASGHYHERLREFSTVYALIRDHVRGVTLLATWRDYAKRYHDQVATRHSPRGED